MRSEVIMEQVYISYYKEFKVYPKEDDGTQLKVTLEIIKQRNRNNMWLCSVVCYVGSVRLVSYLANFFKTKRRTSLDKEIKKRFENSIGRINTDCDFEIDTEKYIKEHNKIIDQLCSKESRFNVQQKIIREFGI